MNENNIFSMIFDVIKNGFKNKLPVGIAIIGPLLIMIILGYMVTMAGTADTLNIGVLNQDKGLGNISAASKIIEELKSQDNVKVISIKESEIKSSLKDKSIDGAVTFPENFTMGLAMNKTGEIDLLVEGTDQTKAALINRAISSSAIAVAASQGEIPMKINNESFYGKDMGFTDLFFPRVMALATLIFSMVITLLSILQDKKSDRFTKMTKSPIKSSIAYTLGLSVFSFLVVAVILLYAIYVMGITIIGDLGNITVLLMLIALVGTSVAVLVSVIARTERQAFALFAIAIILQILFAGLLVPVARFDYYVQWISYSLPLTYGLDAVKSVVIMGFSLGDVSMDLLYMGVITLIAMILSAIGLKTAQKSQNNNKANEN